MNEQALLLDCVRRLNGARVAYMLTGKLYWDRSTPSDGQLGDVAGVVRVQQDKLDKAYLRCWAADLGISAELESAFAGVLRPKAT